MPKHSKYSKRYRKRRAYNRKFRGRKTVNVNRALQPIPQRYICKMKYSKVFTLDNVTYPAWRFNLNSINNPSRTVTDHQPYGHDQLQLLYNRYRVISVSYVITAYNAVPIRLAAIPANEEVIVSNLSEVVEQPRTKFFIQHPGGPANKIKGKIYLPSLTGRTKQQYMADDRYQAQMGSNPAELAILNVVHNTLTDTFPTGTNCTIQLTYMVELFDPKVVAQS